MQISDERKSKAVGIVRINLGTYITEQEAGGVPQVKRLALEKCPDKAATIEISLKTTLVNANASGQDNLSQMSDVLSAYDSGPESEFDFNDFLEEGKDGGDPTKSAIAKIRSKINKGSTIVKTHIRQSADPTRPPLMIGKQVPSNTELGGIDADSIIEQSKRQN